MLYVIVGPPAAGKTTWLREHSKHGDITIDYNQMAAALTPVDADAEFPEHTFPDHVRMVAKAAWMSAVDAAVTFSETFDVYMIHAMPSPQMMKRYEQLGATIVTLDPGRDVVTDRCKRLRPNAGLVAANQWYDDGIKPRDDGDGKKKFARASSVNDVYNTAMSKIGSTHRWW